MDYKSIKELVSLFNSMDIDLMELKEKDFSLKLEKKAVQTNDGNVSPVLNYSSEKSGIGSEDVSSTNCNTQNKVEQKVMNEEYQGKTVENVNLQKIKAPLVGVFYQSQAPDKPPFAEVGTSVKKGDVIGIIEAMKMINEIKSPYTGTIRSILVSNEQLISFDEVLMEIEVDENV